MLTSFKIDQSLTFIRLHKPVTDEKHVSFHRRKQVALSALTCHFLPVALSDLAGFG